MDREKMVTDIQQGMSFATKFIPAIVKLKKAKDAKSGCWLSDDEVVGVIEALNILRSGPEVPARSEGASAPERRATPSRGKNDSHYREDS